MGTPPSSPTIASRLLARPLAEQENEIPTAGQGVVSGLRVPGLLPSRLSSPLPQPEVHGSLDVRCIPHKVLDCCHQCTVDTVPPAVPAHPQGTGVGDNCPSVQPSLQLAKELVQVV